MVFGEPDGDLDIEVKKLRDGSVRVELRGLDVYDPTTQEARKSSADDVACWFIDTAREERVRGDPCRPGVCSTRASQVDE